MVNADEIDLGQEERPPKWGDTPLPCLENQQLRVMLRAFKKLGELVKRAYDWAYAEILEDCGPTMRVYLTAQKAANKEKVFLDFIDTQMFHAIHAEATLRGLVWDSNEPIDQEIDLSQRGPLEKQIVGALRDAINAHGPIVRDNANSAAKRCIGAIKTYNRRVKS